MRIVLLSVYVNNRRRRYSEKLRNWRKSHLKFPTYATFSSF